MIEQKIKKVVRDIIDFPKEGIVFKDITPILKDQELCSEIIETFLDRFKHLEIDAIVGVESRGFLFGILLANKMKKPFIPIRKQGKLPYKAVCEQYDLEYGSAVLEIHEDAFAKGSKVLIHDDLLATGGTINAAAKLVGKLGGEICGFSFLIGLSFLNGKDILKRWSPNCIVLAEYE